MSSPAKLFLILIAVSIAFLAFGWLIDWGVFLLIRFF